MNKQDLLDFYNQNRERIFEEWKEFLRFRSVSTDPIYREDCLNCAAWLLEHLSKLGFKTELRNTSTNPVIWAEWPGDSRKQKIIFYGHYDVQPIDPLELWKSPPFEPQLRDGRMYARGAQDNKGQTFYFIKALEYLISRGELKSPMILLIEGDEESGSVGLSQELPPWRDELQADVLFVCDTGGYYAGAPWLTLGLRGLIWAEVRLLGAKHDLHSGALGGVVRNPATEIARLVSSLHDSNGRIAISDYYKDVLEPTQEERQLLAQSSPSAEQLKVILGLEPSGGETQYPPMERRGFRPTVEVNGIFSGYSGPGTKTIIPAQAGAKLTSRLVPQQKGSDCLELLIRHLEQHVPKELKLEIIEQGIGGEALRLDARSNLLKKVRSILGDVGSKPVEFIWEGGSIPIVSALAKLSGAEPLLLGFGLEEDRIHAPNESFSIDQFALGFTSVGLLLGSFSGESS